MKNLPFIDKFICKTRKTRLQSYDKIQRKIKKKLMHYYSRKNLKQKKIKFKSINSSKFRTISFEKILLHKPEKKSFIVNCAKIRYYLEENNQGSFSIILFRELKSYD